MSRRGMMEAPVLGDWVGRKQVWPSLVVCPQKCWDGCT